MPTITCILLFLACYLLGGVPFGLLLGRLKGLDIRQHGSGNIGATNVGRVCGRGWGICCFILDGGKGLLAVLVAIGLAPRLQLEPDVAGITAAAGTVVGHIFSVYLKFKGGKGVATAAGAMLGLAPWAILIGLAVWLVVLAIWRYVGLASIAAAVALPLAALALNQAGRGPLLSPPVVIVLAMLATLTVVRHKSNIRRMLAGTEPKLGQTRKEAAAHEDRGA